MTAKPRLRWHPWWFAAIACSALIWLALLAIVWAATR